MGVTLKARIRSSKSGKTTCYGYPATVDNEGNVYATVPEELVDNEIASGRFVIETCGESSDKKEQKKRTRKADNSTELESETAPSNSVEASVTVE